jgi:hypothetical protein
MDINNFFAWVRNGFRPETPLPDEVVRGFIRTLEQIRKEDTPCSEVFARLDVYVEKEIGGEDAARLMPLLKEHLEICSDCCEEYEALLTVLEKTTNKESGS